MSDIEVNNQKNPDLDDKPENVAEDEKTDTLKPKTKKGMNLSQEERDKRAERMRKLRAKLDDIGTKPKIQKKDNDIDKPKKPVKKIEKIEEKEEEEIVETDSEESSEEEPEPLPKAKKPVKKNVKNKGKVKPTPRKVFKIKYYDEPTQAELLQDRLFLENQHRTDNDYKYMKKKNEPIKKDVDDLSEKLFNY